ncbi:MAG: hypothetical protein ACRCXD_13355 [Luteolibacter sp.]
MKYRWILPLVTGFGLAIIASAHAAPIPLLPTTGKDKPLAMTQVRAADQSISAWVLDPTTGPLTFKPQTSGPLPPSTVYLAVSYLDEGYGKMDVQLISPGDKPLKPDRFLNMSLTNSGKLLTSHMRFQGERPGNRKDWSFRIARDRSSGGKLVIQRVSLQDVPFDDPNFKLVISDPWKGPYQGPRVKPADNTTLKGKVMVGYQGWFRTPNDLEGKGWVHWGNLPEGTFSIDMWPDTSQYPPSALEKAAEVKLKSGKQAQLFSSTWPAVVDTHFRWMREHDIDGAFLQRFVKDSFYSISGGPEWVLAHTRASANREGRIWAIEYDISSCSEDKLLDTMTRDWKWLVDEFRLFEDPSYAREGGKPVVFIWGLPFPNREISSKVADQVVEFFKNDPKYGGNHVIGGIPSGWRKMEPAWQEHFKKYETILTWMPKSYAEDLANFTKMGIAYYPHVKPGFSWANLKHLPTGDDTLSYTPREGGRFYWNQLKDAAQAGGDRLFVGMFDEYDEATAIMPMSDDSPPTPTRPGVGAMFYSGATAQENGDYVSLPRAELELGKAAPSKRTKVDHFFVRMGGRITFPKAGTYKFTVEGVEGDGVELHLNGDSILRAPALKGTSITAKGSVTVAQGDSMPYLLECRHLTGKGVLRLLWETPDMPRQPVDPSALLDAWGRFITNEGKSPDWWMELTRMGKEMINGKRNPSDAVQGLTLQPQETIPSTSKN